MSLESSCCLVNFPPYLSNQFTVFDPLVLACFTSKRYNQLKITSSLDFFYVVASCIPVQVDQFISYKLRRYSLCLSSFLSIFYFLVLHHHVADGAFFHSRCIACQKRLLTARWQGAVDQDYAPLLHCRLGEAARSWLFVFDHRNGL